MPAVVLNPDGPAPSYPTAQPVQRMNVTHMLWSGTNTLAVHVYYQGLINRVWHSGDLRQGRWLQLTARVNSGRDCLLTTSSSQWRCLRVEAFSGSITGYDTQFLENINQRQIPDAWMMPGQDDSQWAFAVEKPEDDHHLMEQITPPLSIREIEPTAVQELSGEGWIYDFGREWVGTLSMKAYGNDGQLVEIRCGEELLENGRVRYQMRCNCTYQETWTLRSGFNEYAPFDYKAFRYAEILAADGVVDPSSVRFRIRHYPFPEEVCSLETKGHNLVAIWDLCRHGSSGSRASRGGPWRLPTGDRGLLTVVAISFVEMNEIGWGQAVGTRSDAGDKRGHGLVCHPCTSGRFDSECRTEMESGGLARKPSRWI